MRRRAMNTRQSRMTTTMANNIEVLVSITCDAWTDALPNVEDICKTAGSMAMDVEPTQDVEGSLQSFLPRLPLLEGTPREISILLTDDKFMTGLNRDYRKIDQPTNVLSFSNFGKGIELPELPEEETLIYGDVVVAFETVKKEAEIEAKSLEGHLSHMIIHGVLHLLGYDHEEDLEAKKMEAIGIQMLGSLGFDDPHTLAHGN